MLKVADVPDPKVGPDEVLLAVRACGLNHVDVWTRRGMRGLKLDMPHVIGTDVAGVVAGVGRRVRGFRTGDRVVVNSGLSCGRCEFCRAGEESLCPEFRILGEHVDGGCAEFVSVPARNLHKIPARLKFEDAAAASLTFLTAWRMLVTRAGVRRGDTALIHGAGSGVSVAAVKIAKYKGAKVLVTSRSEWKLRRAREIGADVLINSARRMFDEEVWRLTGRKGVDVVVDHVGPATWPQSLRSLKRDGRMVVCGATTGPIAEVDVRQLFWRQLGIIGSTMASQKEFEAVMRLVGQGRLKPVIHAVMPMSKAREANEILEADEQFGKIVLVPDFE